MRHVRTSNGTCCVPAAVTVSRLLTDTPNATTSPSGAPGAPRPPAGGIQYRPARTSRNFCRVDALNDCYLG